MGDASVLLGSINIGLHSDGCIRSKREADEVMHPSYLVPIVRACGGSVMMSGLLQLF